MDGGAGPSGHSQPNATFVRHYRVGLHGTSGFQRRQRAMKTASEADFAEENDVEDEKIYSIVEHAVEKDIDPVLSLATLMFPEGGSTASIAGLPIRRGDASTPKTLLPLLKRSLQQISQEQADFINKMCSAHATEIAGCVRDLHASHNDAKTVRSSLLENNKRLQETGQALERKLGQQKKVTVIQQNVTVATETVESALATLRLVSIVESRIREHRLHKALLLLEDICTEHLGMPPSGMGNNMGSAGMWRAKEGSVGVGQQRANLANMGMLHEFLVRKVRALSNEIERKSLQDFNAWLTSIRAAAHDIGRRAVRDCLNETQRDSVFAQERKNVQAHLMLHRDPRLAAELITQSITAPGNRGLSRPGSWARQSSNQFQKANPLTAGPVRRISTGNLLLRTPTGERGNQSANARRRSMNERGELLRMSLTSNKSRMSRNLSADGTCIRRATYTIQIVDRGESVDDVDGEMSLAQQLGSRSPNNLSQRGRDVSVGRMGSALLMSQTSIGTQDGGGMSLTRGKEISAGKGPARTESLSVFPLDSIDMKQLYNAAFIQQCLGKMTEFQTNYFVNRRLQMMSDLAAPSEFLDNYQPYLTRLAGFFIVEDKVQRTAAQLMSARQVESLWTAAVTTMKGTLDAAFEGIVHTADVQRMLLVKDFVHTLWRALSKCRYNVQPLRQILLDNVEKYHLLLAKGFMHRLEDQLHDLLRMQPPVTVSNIPDFTLYFFKLGLPPTLEDDTELPTEESLPITAPFSKMVPSIMRDVREYIVDSAAYLQGLLNPGEVLPAVRQERTRLISRSLVPTLTARIDLLPAGLAELPSALQLVVDGWALTIGLSAMDRFTATTARGGDKSDETAELDHGLFANVDDDLAQVTREALKFIETATLKYVTRCVAAHVSELVGPNSGTDWLPANPMPSGPSDQILAVIKFLDSVARKTATSLPSEEDRAMDTLGHAFAAAAAAYANELGADASKGFNAFAATKLLEDAKALRRAARRHGAGDHAYAPLQPVVTAAQYVLGEIVGPETLKAGDSPDMLMGWDPDVIPILSKYKDLPYSLARTGQDTRKRRDVESALKTFQAMLRD